MIELFNSQLTVLEQPKYRCVSPILKQAEGLILKTRVQYDILTESSLSSCEDNTDKPETTPVSDERAFPP